MGKWVKRAASEWAEIFGAQSRSKKSAAGFCRDQGIPYEQFLYFRRRCGENNSAFAVVASGGAAVSVRGRKFISLAVERGCPMRLKFPRGMVVESDGVLPASWVVEAAERWLRMGE